MGKGSVVADQAPEHVAVGAELSPRVHWEVIGFWRVTGPQRSECSDVPSAEREKSMLYASILYVRIVAPGSLLAWRPRERRDKRVACIRYKRKV